MIFDVPLEIDDKEKVVNFVIETPEVADNGMAIDLLSGQHYVNKYYCSQRDTWRRIDRLINKPNYSVGVVPGVLDQLGKPQKIIVFGDSTYYAKHFQTSSFEARIVGGFIEQECPYGGCLNQGDWTSRLVFMGVQKGHKDFDKVSSYDDLSKIIQTDYLRASIENVNGQNYVAGKYYPAYRMGGVVSAKQALSYFKQNSIFLNQAKLKSIQKSCHRLYDVVWDKIGKYSEYELEIAKLNADKNLSSDQYAARLGELNQLDRNLFYKRFIRYYKKYEREYKTCTKYVYPSNINENSYKHWFFTYFSAVNLVHGMNNYFDCERKTWRRNPKTITGKRYISLERMFRGCNADQIDSAFNLSVNYLESMHENGYNSYRYIDYDRGALGTHQKIYSWVPLDNKKMKCEKSSQMDGKSFKIFPSGVKWKKRALKNKFKKRFIF
jgi:hypothetical protein